MVAKQVYFCIRHNTYIWRTMECSDFLYPTQPRKKWLITADKEPEARECLWRGDSLQRTYKWSVQNQGCFDLWFLCDQANTNWYLNVNKLTKKVNSLNNRFREKKKILRLKRYWRKMKMPWISKSFNIY